ncbi:MAG TPA: HAD-IC family P-type ATPase, partial [Nevskiaceae bacterium]
DTAATTGESRPQARRAGDSIPAGSIALGAALTLRITRDVQAHAATIAAPAMAENRAATDDGLARRFVWRVAALVLATAGLWLWQDPTRAFGAVVAVLVVACPCAFGLAAPAALTRGVAVLARRGVLVLRPEALRRLAAATRVVFDKTGTLMRPALAVDGVQTFRGTTHDGALRLAATLARASSHPLSRAVTDATRAADITPLPGVLARNVPGRGMQATVIGRRLRLGRADPSADPAADDDGALWLTDDAGPLAHFPVREAPEPDAARTVAALRMAGLMPIILSGDAAARVERVARTLGVARWAARQSPDDKRARVRAEQATGEVVLVVGDGSNDAQALEAADASAVTAGATDLARRRADLVLASGLSGLATVRSTATRMAHITRTNRRWALAWNLGAVSLAALGFIPPWLAMAGMAVSSLVVVLNTLRIRDGRPGPRTSPTTGTYAA